MSNSEYLKRYLGTCESSSDFKQPKKKKRKTDKKTRQNSGFQIIDNNINGWAAEDQLGIEDREFTDVGIFAPTVVENLELEEEESKIKWKKNSFKNAATGKKKQRHDSSDSDDSDSDVSVSRGKTRHDSSSDSSENEGENNDQSSDDSDIDVRRMKDGGKAGLNSAKEFKNARINSKSSATTAHQIIEKGQEKTVFRDRSGRAQTLLDKRKEDDEKARRKQAEKDKWDNWAIGLSNQKMKQDKRQEAEYEMEKPMARDKNDTDMNNYVKSIQRIGDPMEQYLAEKKKKADKKKGKFPEYQGPVPPPNRFAIKPGYRWDGVDRSTGFERRYFNMLANVRSLREHEVRYMTEDM